MKTSERRSSIKNELAVMGELEFGSLASRYGVSEMTIRRDAEYFEHQGIARRVRGGLILLNSIALDTVFENRSTRALEAKRAIAEAVVGLLIEDEAVILDSGSTLLEVAREIRAKQFRLTTVTASIRAALEVVNVPGAQVFVSGGALRPGELSLTGLDAESSFNGLNCDTYIAGIAGIDAIRGVTEFDISAVRVKRAAIGCARRVIVAADKSKFGRVHLVSLLNISQIDTLVTDASPEHPIIDLCEDLGISVIHVEPTKHVIDLQPPEDHLS